MLKAINQPRLNQWQSESYPDQPEMAELLLQEIIWKSIGYWKFWFPFFFRLKYQEEILL